MNKGQNSDPIDIHWIKIGAECWIENQVETIKMNYDAKQEAFFPAVVMQFNDTTKMIKVKYLGLGLPSDEIALKHILQRDGKSGPILVNTLDNLADISVINEAELLRHLRARFLQRKIFASVGEALLITNPYASVPELFSSEVIHLYQNVLNQTDLVELPPHIYGIASSAFKDIFESERNQSIVISGESGSGKTESTKYALNVLTSISSIAHDKMKQSSNQPRGVSLMISLEDQITNCNPILESFGNAKTIRNDNSSRFGKLVTLLIGSTRQIEAAQFQSYLLEKSRVTQQNSEERNFHIFYAMVRGLSDKELDSFGLKPYNQKLDVSRFNYLSANPKPTIDGIDDIKWFQAIQKSFVALSFTPTEIHTILSFLSSILLVGNIDFDEKTLSNDLPCSMDPPKQTAKISQLLQVNQTQLEKAFLYKTRSISTTTVIDSPLNRADCISQRDSIAREIYDCLFQWLIKKINTVMISQAQMTSSEVKKKYKLQILDIFGFEVLNHNSFEQMCINFANEKLQQLFISTIFKKDQAELKLEGLGEHINQISYTDNQNIIDLLEGYPMGIFFLLDENSQIAGTDETMANKIRQQYAAHPKFSAPPLLSKTMFIIKHTPRDVQYDVIGFKAKNKDEVGPNILKTMQQSQNKVSLEIFQSRHGQEEPEQQAGKANKQKTLGAKFRQSIKELIEELQKSRLSFVRCIKPNDFKSKDQFIDIFVLQQLRYLGIADSIRVRKEGFPYRKQYQEFYKRYGEMDNQRFSYPKLVQMGANFNDMVQRMNIWKNLTVTKSQSVGFLFGKSIIFMRIMVRDQIEQQYASAIKRKHDMALKIQKSYFRFKQLKRLRSAKKGIVQLQMIFRVRREYKHFQKKRQKAVILQRWWRHTLFERTRKFIRGHSMVVQKYLKRVACVKAYVNTRNSLLQIQGFLHTKILVVKGQKFKSFKTLFFKIIFDRFWNLMRRKAAIHIQRHARGCIVRGRYQGRVQHILQFRRTYKKKKALVFIQAAIRGFILRRNLARMRRAATYIQGHMRSYWLSQLFRQIRLAAIVIQRAYRFYQDRTGKLKRMLKDYLIKNNMNQYKAQERERFLLLQKNFCKTVFPLSKQNKTWVYPLLISVEVTTDLSDVYDGSFTQSLFDFLKQRSNEGTTVMDLQCGDAHMLASCSNQNLYSWGLNDYYQLGKLTRGSSTMVDLKGELLYNPPLKNEYVIVTSGTRIKSISSGGNHNLCLNYNNELFAFGKNTQGEIGLSSLKNLSQPSQFSLEGSKNVYSHSSSRGSQTIIITTNGSVYYNQKGKHAQTKRFNLLQQIPLKTQISQASLGVDFAVLISHSGMVYCTRDSPNPIKSNLEISEIPIKYFHGEKIVQIECGQRHIIARTGLGKVFTWGWGLKGQLGHGNFKSSDIPQPVQLPQRMKSIQVNAGLTSSIVLTDNKKILWWGTNAILNYQNVPISCNIEQLVDMNENFPLKIESTWSRTAGIMYIRMADMSGVNFPGLNKSKVAQQIAIKWAEQNNQQDVPYNEAFSKFFQNDVMQAQHYSKDPTFKMAPVVDQMSHTPQLVKNRDENFKQEVVFFEHFGQWEASRKLNPQYVEDELLITSNEVSPQKQLEYEKLKLPRTPRITTTSTMMKNPQSSNYSRPMSPISSSLGFSSQFGVPTTNSFVRQETKQETKQSSQLEPHFHDTHTQKIKTKILEPQQPHFGQNVILTSTINQQRKSINRSHTPTKLIFKSNGESQEYIHQHQAQIHTNHTQSHPQQDIDILQKLQRKLTTAKLKMETILKIPKSQWTQSEIQFMDSMQDHQLRSHLQKLN